MPLYLTIRPSSCLQVTVTPALCCSYREKGPEGEHDVQWTTEDDRALEVEVGKTREGMGFFCVKKLSS